MLSLFEKKPKPFFPITQPSKILTLSLIIVFLIITLEPIEQLEPIWTFFSIIVLWPIEQFLPIFTFLPIKIFFPNFTFFLKDVLEISFTESSKSSTNAVVPRVLPVYVYIIIYIYQYIKTYKNDKNKKHIKYT